LTASDLLAKLAQAVRDHDMLISNVHVDDTYKSVPAPGCSRKKMARRGFAFSTIAPGPYDVARRVVH
jgi:hypothetical protein